MYVEFHSDKSKDLKTNKNYEKNKKTCKNKPCNRSVTMHGRKKRGSRDREREMKKMEWNFKKYFGRAGGRRPDGHETVICARKNWGQNESDASRDKCGTDETEVLMTTVERTDRVFKRKPEWF
jgi:hypothetical protein